MKINKSIKSFLFIFLMLSGANLYALDQVPGKISVVSASDMPHYIAFQMDVSGPGCPVGSWMIWNKFDHENHKANLATLNAALLSQRQTVVYLASGSCNVQYIHLTR